MTGKPPVSVTGRRLRPLTFLPASKLRGSPLSAVFTDWLSTTPADGPVRRPSALRASSIRRWRIDTHKPLSRQTETYRDTARHGGNAFGGMRHGQPL